MRKCAVICEFRTGVETDLRKLEWHGEFFDHRQIIEQTFVDQLAGRGLVLLGVVNDFPVAQLWVRFASSDRPPRLWAFRVMRLFQGSGVGSELLRFGERELARRHFGHCEIGVDKHNDEARRFYESRGYRLSYEEVENYSYLTPTCEARTGVADQWVLCKGLLRCVTETAAAEIVRLPVQVRRGGKLRSGRSSSARAAPR